MVYRELKEPREIKRKKCKILRVHFIPSFPSFSPHRTFFCCSFLGIPLTIFSSCVYHINWDKFSNKTNQSKDKKNMEKEQYASFCEHPISPRGITSIVPTPLNQGGGVMEMEYREEGGFIIMKAGGEMPEELLKIIKAMEILVEECNMEKNMK